ncbi:phosphatase PAP2 family protein [Gordonia sp. TBRC 11910]|uniref:Phosphatase PAP2 family protein n=1 Tax=Gordonia asplenii TaxID=2725283 RepID=A0A848L4W8_9ACTN|nr:phosphatase PAP2 family protein [Gordonia asplenii]NMO03643.1 phosphatase PAP2 family protein [Gordonia asplenii]
MRRPPTVVIAGCCLALLVVIVGVAVALNGGGPFGIDSTVMSWMLAHRAATAQSSVSTLTAVDTLTWFFSPVAVCIWTVLLAVAIGVRDRTAVRAIPIAATVAAAGAAGEVAKIAVNRPRPSLVYQLGTPEATYSYPSGHVTGTSALAVVAVVIVGAAWSRTTRLIAAAAAALVILTAAATRLYLGVHWVTDVMAGACLGTAVALVIPAVSGRALPILAVRAPDRMRRYLLPAISASRRPPAVAPH